MVVVAPSILAELKCRLVHLAAKLADKLQNGVNCDEHAVRCEITDVESYIFAAEHEDVCKIEPKLIDEIIRYSNSLNP